MPLLRRLGSLLHLPRLDARRPEFGAQFLFR
jgi:hypothetical protein